MEGTKIAVVMQDWYTELKKPYNHQKIMQQKVPGILLEHRVAKFCNFPGSLTDIGLWYVSNFFAAEW